MRLWKTPERLRRTASLIFVALPLVFFSTLIARRMPWWRWNPLEEWPIWAGLLVALSLLFLAIVRVRRWAYVLTTLSCAIYAVSCVFISIRQENVGLALFSIGFGVVAYAFLARLGSDFDMPAIKPGIRWFQTLPEPIPGVTLDWGDRKNLRLSQLDLDGGFILGRFDAGFEKSLPHEVTLHYRGSKTSCAVRVLSALESKIDSSWTGFGVEFKNTDRDTRKELSDFIEVLRGEGHVST
jgi:hypothetical protein